MVIRPFQDADAEPLSHVIRACFEAMPAGTYSPEFMALQIHLYDREHILQDAREMRLSVVVDDDRLIGSGGYSAEKIRALYVDPAHQHRGVGSQVLAFLLAEARAAGRQTIRTWSTRVAESFYLKHGFRKLGHVSFPDLGFLEVFVDMEKRLVE